MDASEGRIVEDIKRELILSKRENQRLAEKLDCLIILITGAWQGASDSILKISEIVGIPPPKIIPLQKEGSEHDHLGQEYLHLTSSLLDEQLKKDATIKIATKVLRPSSGKHVVTGSRRVQSATQRTPTSKSSRPLPSQQKKNEIPVKDINLTDILPMFAQMETKDNAPRRKGGGNTKDDSEVGMNKNVPRNLFNTETVVGRKKVRPVSAALQQRQDYLRTQAKSKKSRPHTAKPAFRHVTDSEYNAIVRNHHGQQSPVSSPENAKDPRSVGVPINDDIHPSILVNISPKNPQRAKVITSDRNFFPEERDDQALGDVTDALHRVQEMEKLFRRNTRRLQQKIGIPEAGCI